MEPWLRPEDNGTLVLPPAHRSPRRERFWRGRDKGAMSHHHGDALDRLNPGPKWPCPVFEVEECHWAQETCCGEEGGSSSLREEGAPVAGRKSIYFLIWFQGLCRIHPREGVRTEDRSSSKPSVPVSRDTLAHLQFHRGFCLGENVFL
jgi:hypothetical protein